MTWFSIIEKKGRAMSIHAKKSVDEVMEYVSEPKTVREILELVSLKKTGASSIPTNAELRRYLSKNYNFWYFDRITGKPKKTHNSRAETKYWGDGYDLV
tara:strand:- start:208 stop:504 length:297 start_codon:yes stop_codon:yes gene_type:complete